MWALFGYFLAAFTIVGAVLNIYKNKYGFILFIITDFGWIIYNAFTNTWEQIPVWITLIATSTYGYFLWSKETI